ncbi:MAG: DUF4296 domain-containing protein [Bacteroidota bacterium]
MTRTIFNLAVLSVSLLGCKERDESYPVQAIPKDSLVDILADLHLLRAEAQQLSSIDPASAKADSTAWTSHGWSGSDFTVTMGWFERHPEALSEIYEEVINELSRREEAATAAPSH